MFKHFLSKKRILLFVTSCFGLLIIFIITTNLIIYLGTKKYIYNEVEATPEAEAVLIPGAAIFPDGSLSPVFLDRVDMAIKLYEAKKVSKILVSGDNSTDSHNEVNPVRLYLIDKGIPENDIFLDHAGFDTYSSMYRARDIFGVTSMLISTQSFHLPRAIFTARQLRIEAFGVKADVVHIRFRNYLREVLANEKAVLNLIFDRKPKFLGEEIPITADGGNNLEEL